MNHEAWENDMIDTFDQRNQESTQNSQEKKRVRILSKEDSAALVIGLKRTLLALITIALFAASVAAFIGVAYMGGYAAVGMFFAAILTSIATFTMLFAQGVAPTSKESAGEKDA